MDYSQKYQKLRNKTIPGLFLERVKTTPNEVAYRAKKLGIYKERTWLDFYRMVANCAMGLSQLGLKHSNCIALMGDPCEEYIICELAAQSLGGISFGIYPNSSEKELHYLLKDGRPSIFVVENQEYLDRILPYIDQFSHLRKIVIIDTRGLFTYDHPALVRYQQLIQIGKEKLEANPDAFEEMVNRIEPSDGLFIAYTSGTTGNPKGVLISHSRQLAAAFALIDHYPILSKLPHRAVIFLPLCNALDKFVALILPLLAPVVPHFGENIDDLNQTLFETAPTILFTVPGYLKKFLSGILEGIENSSPFKKIFYNMSLRIGHQHLKYVWKGKKSLPVSFAYFISYQIVFRPILNKIGLNKLKIAFSMGEPLPSEVITLWQIYGVNLSEMYGLTEVGGSVISAQGSRFPKPGNAGKPLACWEVRVSESGEILVRGNGIFEGYWNNPKLTTEVLDSDGWFHTGDVGEWTSNGHLRILGRAKDFVMTSGGKTISPMLIENILRSSPYIREAVVFGHNRHYLSSLIEIDFESVSDWASRNNIPFTGFISLIQHPEVIKFIGLEIEKANKNLSPGQQIKAFQIIPRDLSPVEDGGLVTPTRKVKRVIIYEKFKELVESMYSGNETRRKVS